MNANLHSPEHMLQIEYIKHPQDYDMGSFHYHNAYELLFLQVGEYTLITMDTAYTICKNQVSLIPPCCMHKSLGRAGNERTLMYFDDRFLNRYFTEKAAPFFYPASGADSSLYLPKPSQKPLPSFFKSVTSSIKMIMMPPIPPL